MWLELIRSDPSFVDRSPHQLRSTAVVSGTPDAVFRAIVDTMQEWFADIRGVEWTSAPPPALGSTRIVRLKPLSVKERFIVFEPGRRFTYAMDAISVPLVKQLVGDVKLEPHGTGSTSVEWVIHYTPSLLMKMVHPLARALFGKMFRDSLRNLDRFVGKG